MISPKESVRSKDQCQTPEIANSTSEFKIAIIGMKIEAAIIKSKFMAKYRRHRPTGSFVSFGRGDFGANIVPNPKKGA